MPQMFCQKSLSSLTPFSLILPTQFTCLSAPPSKQVWNSTPSHPVLNCLDYCSTFSLVPCCRPCPLQSILGTTAREGQLQTRQMLVPLHRTVRGSHLILSKSQALTTLFGILYYLPSVYLLSPSLASGPLHLPFPCCNLCHLLCQTST